MERPQVFADAFKGLAPPEDGPLSERWESKLQENKGGVEKMQRLYVNLRRNIIISLSVCHIVGKEGRGV